MKQNFSPPPTESRLSVRDLPAGLYFCTLLADGVPVQTQRLLVTH